MTENYNSRVATYNSAVTSYNTLAASYNTARATNAAAGAFDEPVAVPLETLPSRRLGSIRWTRAHP